MAQRTTKAELDTAFRLFLTSINGHKAEGYGDVGGYLLDQGYGGYQVVQIANEHGGQSCPFGYLRRPAREMCATLRFATDAANIAKGER